MSWSMHAGRSAQLEEENIPRLLWRFSLPAIVGMVAQALYYAVDRIFVGQALGAEAIAGMTVAFPFMLILMAFGMLIGYGAAATVSLRLGQRDRQAAQWTLGNASVLLVVAAVVLTPLGYCLLHPLLKLFGASPEILPYGRQYLEVIVFGAVFQLLSFGLNAVIRAEGNPRVAMLTMLISVFLNAAITPLFLFGFGWGMRGAAAATVLAQMVSTVWVIGYFLSEKSLLKLRFRDLWLQGPVCRQIFALGCPLFIMQMAACLLQSILNHQLQRYGGDLAVSVMGILYSLFMLIAMPIFGINQGAQPIIGYNYGAERFDRVKKTLLTAILAASAITLSGFLIAYLFPLQLVRLFDRDDAALAALGEHAIRIAFLMAPIVGFQVVSSSYFQAVGRPTRALLLMLSRQVLLLIPAALLLPRFFGLDGVWISFPVADGCSSLLTAACLVAELGRLHRQGKAACKSGRPQ